MRTRKSDALIAKLGASLEKPSSAQQFTEAASQLSENETELAAKISISLYADDLDHVDAITAFMTRHRIRVNRSEAIKIALRGVKLNDELLAVYKAIKKDDGRRRGKE
jgi:glucose/arabinose dehydrogenase